MFRRHCIQNIDRPKSSSLSAESTFVIISMFKYKAKRPFSIDSAPRIYITKTRDWQADRRIHGLGWGAKPEVERSKYVNTFPSHYNFCYRGQEAVVFPIYKMLDVLVIEKDAFFKICSTAQANWNFQSDAICARSIQLFMTN